MAPASHHHITICSIQPLKRGEETGRYLPPYATVSFQDRCVVKSKALENLLFLRFPPTIPCQEGKGSRIIYPTLLYPPIIRGDNNVPFGTCVQD